MFCEVIIWSNLEADAVRNFGLKLRTPPGKKKKKKRFSRKGKLAQIHLGTCVLICADLVPAWFVMLCSVSPTSPHPLSFRFILSSVSVSVCLSVCLSNLFSSFFSFRQSRICTRTQRSFFVVVFIIRIQRL